jgi:hypothetical protein
MALYGPLRLIYTRMELFHTEIRNRTYMRLFITCVSTSLFITRRSFRPKHRFAGAFESREWSNPRFVSKRLLRFF